MGHGLWLAVVAIVVSTTTIGIVATTNIERAQARKLQPRDQSNEDAEFAAWKRTLLIASERGDVAILRAAFAPVVRVDFEELKRDAAVAAAQLSEGRPWRALRDALRLGAAREDNRFVAPYVFAARGRLAADEAAITGDHVNLRSEAAPDAGIVAVLSFDIVRLDDSHAYDSELFEREDHPTGAKAWAKIITSNGATGYVYGRYIRAPSDVRFVFQRIDGQWRITSMAAGD